MQIDSYYLICTIVVSQRHFVRFALPVLFIELDSVKVYVRCT